MRLALTLLPIALVSCMGTPERTDTTSVAPTTSVGDTAAVRDSTPTSPAATTLTAEGWGPVRIGMSRAQIVAAAGADANPNAVGGPDPESCDHFRPKSTPEGFLVMVERDTLTRITMSRNTSVKTDAGFAVGDSAAAIERHYGTRAEVTPHKYVEAPARYITIWMRGRPPAASARGIRYEIGNDGRVVHIHAGGPSIRYVEGCS